MNKYLEKIASSAESTLTPYEKKVLKWGVGLGLGSAALVGGAAYAHQKYLNSKGNLQKSASDWDVVGGEPEKKGRDYFNKKMTQDGPAAKQGISNARPVSGGPGKVGTLAGRAKSLWKGSRVFRGGVIAAGVGAAAYGAKKIFDASASPAANAPNQNRNTYQ